ncbi:MAG: LysR family transcriptional regulator [Oscillospiraceae bacterium]|jgi:LysR family transcriptional activator of glutamate synthase operon
MELRDLRYFCMTAELEHVTKAANKLGVAQPYLTKVIGQIEEEIGARLFDKVGRQIKLNKYGEAFYTQARKVLASMDNLYNEMDLMLDRQGRNITLLSNTEAYTPDLIEKFYKNHSNYTVSIFYSSYTEMLDALKTGEADFALTYPPINQGAASGIVTELAFYDVGWILLPPGHPLLKKRVIHFEDLRGEKLVTSPKDSAIRWKVEPLYEKSGMEMDIVCESNDLDVLTRAVGCGMGYAFMPSLYMNDRPELYDHAVEVLAPQEDRQGYFGFSYSENIKDNRNAMDFRDFAMAYFRQMQAEVFYTHTNDIPAEYGLVDENGFNTLAR